MKIYLLLGLFLGLGESAFSQIELRLGAAAGIPVGDFGQSVTAGIGIPLSGYYFFKDKIGLGLHTGYYNFITKTEGTSISIIPIALSAEYNFAKDGLIPYLGLDVGFYRYASSVTYQATTFSSSRIYFGIGPHAGFKYMFSDNIGMNGNFKMVNIFGDAGVTFFTLDVGVVVKL